MGHDIHPRFVKGLTLGLTACLMFSYQAYAGDMTPNTVATRAPLNSANLKLAIPDLKQSTWIKPHSTPKISRSPKQLLAQARDQIRSGHLKAALLLITTVIKLDDHDYHAWNALGEIYHELGNAAQSMKAFNKAHALDPELATTCEYG